MLLLVAWPFRLPLLTHIVTRLAENAEVKITHLTWDTITLSEAKIKSIRLEENVTAKRYSIDANQLTVSYSLSLDTGFTVKSLSADSLDLTPQDTERPVLATAPPPTIFIHDLFTTIATFSQTPLPFDRLNINEVNYHHPIITLPFHLSANADGHLVSVQLSDHHSLFRARVHGNEHHRTIDASLTEVEHITALPSKTEAAKQSFFSLKASLDEKAVNAIGELNLAKAKSWWSAYAPRLDGSHPILQSALETHLDDNFTVELSAKLEQGKWQTVLKLPKTRGTVSDMSGSIAAIFYLNLPDELPSQGPYSIAIKSGTSLYIDNLLKDHLSIEQLQITPQGEVSIASEMTALMLNEKSAVKMAQLNISSERSGDESLLQISTLSLAPRLTFTRMPSESKVRLEPGFKIDLSSVKTGLLETPRLQGTILEATELNMDADQEWQLLNGKWMLEQPNLHFFHPDITLDSRKITANIQHIGRNSADLRILVGSLKASVSEARTQTDTQTNSSTNINKSGRFGATSQHQHPSRSHRFDYINAQINVDPKGISTWVSLKPKELRNRIDLNARYTKRSGRLRYRVANKGRVDLKENAPYINNWLEIWGPQATLTGGHGNFKISGTWDKKSEHKIRLTGVLESLQGQYKQQLFNGLNVTVDTSYPPENEEDVINIQLDELDAGILLTNINTQIRLRKRRESRKIPELEVEHLSGEVFGGRFSIHPFTFDSKTDAHEILFSTFDLDIAQILELQKVEGLIVTGKLNGALPITMDKHGIHVIQGRFENQLNRGGLIQYHIDSAKAAGLSSALTETVIKALEEFHYSVMTADVNYQPDGQLYINFHIRGKSPHLSTHRPVHFNINSEQNVLSLLQSLQYANQLNRSVENRFDNQD